jgi:hypothetical protein
MINVDVGRGMVTANVSTSLHSVMVVSGYALTPIIAEQAQRIAELEAEVEELKGAAD